MIRYPGNCSDTLQLTEKTLVKIDKGRIVEKIIFGPSGTLDCRCIRSYSPEGEVVEFTTFVSDDKIDVKKIHSYENRQRIKTQYFDQKGELFSTTKYLMDSVSKTRISMEVLDDNRFDNVILTELNNVYLPIRVYSIPENKNRILIGTTEYDSLNRIKVSKDWNLNKSRYDHIEYVYDSLNRITGGAVFDSNGILLGNEIISYDTLSNITYNRTYHSPLKRWKTYSFEYEYDNYKNWVIRTKWLVEGDDRILIESEKRKFNYF